MKTALLALLLASVALAADIPPFPSTLTLTTGAVLRSTRVERWEKDQVIVRHAGGIDPVRFSLLAPASRASVMAIVEAFNQPRTVTGSVYIKTRGAGAYKFARTLVTAYPESAIRDGKIIQGSTALASGMTDVDGKFSLKLPHSRSAFLVCVASRRLIGETETTLWVVPITSDQMDLSDANSR